MCGLMLGFIIAAALWQRRRHGGVARIDFSMIEAMLWTMTKPLLAMQSGVAPMPQGNRSARYVPHGAYRCAGDDEWVAIAVGSDREWQALCTVVPDLSPLAGLHLSERVARQEPICEALTRWLRVQSATSAADRLVHAGVPAAALANSLDLVGSEHLREREFWDAHEAGVLPSLPWRASFGRKGGTAPGLGADTDAVLADVLGLSAVPTVSR